MPCPALALPLLLELTQKIVARLGIALSCLSHKISARLGISFGKDAIEKISKRQLLGTMPQKCLKTKSDRQVHRNRILKGEGLHKLVLDDRCQGPLAWRKLTQSEG